MILFTLLTIIAITATLIAVVVGGLVGGAGIVVFGDVIVCVAIIVFICKKIIEKKQGK